MQPMEEIEYMNAENGSLKKRIKELEEIEHKYNQLCWQHDALEDECNKADERIKELEECCKWCKGNALPPIPTTEKEN